MPINTTTLAGITAASRLPDADIDNAGILARLQSQGINASQLGTAVYNAIVTDAQNAARLEAEKKLLDAQNKTIDSPVTKQTGVPSPTNYRWNLPPHQWSLPVQPQSIDPYFVGKQSTADSFHGFRRGRLWFWGGASDITQLDDKGQAKTAGQIATEKLKAGDVQVGSGGVLNQNDNNYGFQFLWNPTTISTSVARNMDITPSPADTLKVVSGAFPGQETVTFNIQLDRVNDFACLKALKSPELFSKYYGSSYPTSDTSETFQSKVGKLLTRGTMADLEYLFKAINGGYAWKNLLGKETANIGFLMPTLLGMQIGPDLESLNYVGWLTNIGIQHTDFTQNMVPIRTTVSINMECFAGSAITALGG
jgi:hypothetical protein